MFIKSFYSLVIINLFLICVDLPNPLYAQVLGGESTLFSIGNEKITNDEFRKRFEFSPRITSGRNFDSVKVEFLYSLIAEKLWAKEAKELLIDTTEYVQLSLEYVKKMYVRDALYKQEIKDKIQINPDEIDDGINKIQRLLKLRYINSKSESTAREIYKAIKIQKDFDSLCLQSDGINSFCDTISITFGKMQKIIEDAVI